MVGKINVLSNQLLLQFIVIVLAMTILQTVASDEDKNIGNTNTTEEQNDELSVFQGKMEIVLDDPLSPNSKDGSQNEENNKKQNQDTTGYTEQGVLSYLKSHPIIVEKWLSNKFPSEDGDSNRNKRSNQDQLACTILEGTCQRVKDTCDGDLMTGDGWCKNPNKYGCCIPPNTPAVAPAIECPRGFFSLPQWNQYLRNPCYRLLNDTLRNFHDAKSACSALGLRLAQPDDPVTLRDILITEYGLNTYTWLGGVTTGSAFAWLGTGHDISSPNNKNSLCLNSLWWSEPGTSETNSLVLMTSEGNRNSKPNKPYYSVDHLSSYWTLCEQYRTANPPLEPEPKPTIQPPTAGCPNGTFFFGVSNQCFRLLKDIRRTWDEATEACSDLGLQLAQTDEPVFLRFHIINEYDHAESAWVNARYHHSEAYKWQGSGELLARDSHFWYPGGFKNSRSYCVRLLSNEGAWKHYPTQPYYGYPCSQSAWTLCEYVRE